jgi:hypothetical protein
MDVQSGILQTVEIWTRRDVADDPHWSRAFVNQRKDCRYYELIEDTINPEFEYRYFVFKDGTGTIRAVQPFFVLDLDLLIGAGPRYGSLIKRVRRFCPRFMRLRTLMVGCAAGEGHLDAADEGGRHAIVQVLRLAIHRLARELAARLIVLKEFPAIYRPVLQSIVECGFTRIPSLPMTRVSIDYTSFEDYANRALNSHTRNSLRRKFRRAEQAPGIELSVITDLTPVIDDVYPLYLNVHERSELHFEKCTKAYFCGLGRLMPDKVRFFVWRRQGEAIAFAACMLQENAIYAEYVGFDYDYALDLHLYHYAYRDVVSWAISHGYKEFRSSGLNYDPKLHLRHRLDPLDLYVRHVSPPLNAVLRVLLPWLEPTQYDQTLKKFANYYQLHR